MIWVKLAPRDGRASAFGKEGSRGGVHFGSENAELIGILGKDEGSYGDLVKEVLLGSGRSAEPIGAISSE